MSKQTNLVESALPKLPDMSEYSFAIINTAWNRDITEKLEVGAMKTLTAHKVKKSNIKVYTAVSYTHLCEGTVVNGNPGTFSS